MGRKRIKQYLTLLLTAGVVAVVASSSGTFASFTAETTNPDNTFETGTIFLHNTANGGTTCTSETSAGNAADCSTLFSNLTITPGQTRHAYLTLTNAGTLTASSIQFYRSSCAEGTPTIATLDGAVANADPTGGSLTVNGDLTQALVAGTPLLLKDGATTQVFHVGAAGAAAGASSIPVTETAFTQAFSDSSVLQLDTSAFTSAATLCDQLLFDISEASAANGGGSDVGCAWGTLTGATCDLTDATYVLTHPSDTSSAPETLSLVSGQNGNTGTDLSPGKSRYFDLIVKAPASLTNAEQNDEISFSLTWQVTGS